MHSHLFARGVRAVHFVSLFAALAMLQSCATMRQEHASSLQNLGELKTALREYHDSGRYEHDLAAVDARAAAYVHAHAHDAAKPALVLDIDETSLSNFEQLLADDFGYIESGPCDNLPKGPCGTLAYDALARAAVIQPTLDLFNAAKREHVAVFFITGRHEAERDATARNLGNATYAAWDGLIMRPDGAHTASAADYKAAQRATLEAQGFTIIANVGDQPSDLAGGHAQQGFLLPNPYYRIP